VSFTLSFGLVKTEIKNMGLSLKPHFIFLLDKKNETKRIKNNRSYHPTWLAHARRFFIPALSKCFAFIRLLQVGKLISKLPNTFGNMQYAIRTLIFSFYCIKTK